VNKGVKFLLLALLAKSVPGFGQQPQVSSFDFLVASAQRAQAAGDYVSATSDYKQASAIRPDVPELWANLGLMQQETKDLTGAIESFQTANRLKPSLYVPNLFLGIDYAHAGKTKLAIPFLMKAQRMNTTDPEAPLALGRAYIGERNYVPAVKELTRATRLNPRLGDAWFSLGIARLDQVEVDALTMSEAGKQSPYAGALYAESLEKQARFGEAASLYETLLDSKPQPPCLGSGWGFALLRDHKPSAAAAAFSAERKVHPECGLALFGQARLALENGNDAEAAKILTDLWNRDHGFFESNAPILFGGLSNEESASVARLSAASGEAPLPAGLRNVLKNAAGLSAPNPADAVRENARNTSQTTYAVRHTAQEFYAAGEFRHCEDRLGVNLTAMSAAQLRLLAACSFFTGDHERAYEAATALQALQPHSLEALYWSIRADERLALTALARFQQLEPNSTDSHVLLGDIDNQLERYDDAQKEYLRALTLAPSDPAALLGLATAHLNQDDDEGAIEFARSALAHSPDDPELNLIMGEALLGQRKFVESESYLIKSLKAKPQMLPRIHALIGKAYAETGKTQEAIEQLKLGTSSDEDGSVQYLLARMYFKLGDRKDAYEAIRQMKIIKQQRESRGVKRVEDPDLSPLETSASAASTP
jgi:tetratricopeptide (TPR) repeat protein